MTEQTRELALLNTARTALAEARTIDDVLTIRDQGEAAIKYAKSRRDVGLGALQDAGEIVRRAERLLGAMLAGMEKNRGVRLGGNIMLPPGNEPTLSDFGISKMDSSRWQAVARVPDSVFDKWIASEREKGKELTQTSIVKLGRQQTNGNAPPEEAKAIEGVVSNLAELAGQGFACVYADPPWKYGNQGTRAATDNHYPTMTVEEIAAEPVREVIAENAHLHLWTTNAFLFDAKQVIEAWGFEYKSVLVWVKPQMGIGNYWRVSHEFLLFGIRGKCPFRDRSQMSWVQADRTKHSRKPGEIRTRIVKVSPGPYLEMYGRERLDGWTVYGNQIDGGGLF